MNLLEFEVGHVSELQVWDSEAPPAQLAPPLAGAGLLHRRERVCAPPLQVLLQAPHAVHAPQFPLIGTRIKMSPLIFFYSSDYLAYGTILTS